MSESLSRDCIRSSGSHIRRFVSQSITSHRRQRIIPDLGLRENPDSVDSQCHALGTGQPRNIEHLLDFNSRAIQGPRGSRTMIVGPLSIVEHRDQLLFCLVRQLVVRSIQQQIETQQTLRDIG